MRIRASRIWSVGIGVALMVGLAVSAVGQLKRLDHDDYDRWNSISGVNLSRDGQWLIYVVSPVVGDGVLTAHPTGGGTARTLPRGSAPKISHDSRYVAAIVQPSREETERARAERRPANQMPRNALAVMDLATGETRTIERVASVHTPREMPRWLAYRLVGAGGGGTGGGGRPNPSEGGEGGDVIDDDQEQEAPAPGSPKRNDHRPGTTLHVLDIVTGQSRAIERVDQFLWSDDGRTLVYSVSTPDGQGDGVYALNLENDRTTEIVKALGVYRQLTLHGSGRLAFMSDKDGYAEQRNALYVADIARPGARLVAEPSSRGIPEGWTLIAGVRFSESGRRLFFSTRPPGPGPAPEIPEDERVNVDIWSWTDPLIQPMQLRQVNAERNRTYQAFVDLDGGRVFQLETPDMRSATVGSRGDSHWAVATDDRPYQLESSWLQSYNDVYLVDLRNGSRTKVLERARGAATLSPQSNFLVWWDGERRAWFSMDVRSRRTVELSQGLPPVHNELHDTPSEPGSYGSAGWLENEERFLINDAYDVWAVDPRGEKPPVCVTGGYGRPYELRLRVTRFDAEDGVLSKANPITYSATDMRTYANGFYRGTFGNWPRRLVMEDMNLGTPTKADDSDIVVITKQTFEQFPDLYVTTTDFGSFTRVSDANPQQKEYLWGRAELINYRSMHGEPLKGVLIYPGGFEFGKQYPLIVYYYERLSNTVHNYRTPAPGSSSINLSFYASRGYVIFLPDVPYRIGYPGESALASVVPGVQAILDRGFVDPKRIGIQGHSWGGYQTLYLLTRTNLFAAAEAGAPVSNMVSAYGGIRYQTGMSRQFQYERTQSRIGGSLWDYPLRYLENSPIFWADKIETPLLMLHNDEDGAVPWTEGIQMFVALRRLGKPVWLLNYNGEAHGLNRRQNRRDWTIRMQQFFDHYLQGAPPAVWMVEGVPAINKGRTLGLDLVGDGDR